mgnify:CR=1 FL=1
MGFEGKYPVFLTVEEARSALAPKKADRYRCICFGRAWGRNRGRERPGQRLMIIRCFPMANGKS